MNPTAQSRSARQAFTLIEMLAVVALIGVMLGIMLPALRGMRRGKLDQMANSQLMADLNTARHMAISGASAVYVVFFPKLSDFHAELQAKGVVDLDAVRTHLQSSRAANDLVGGQLAAYALYTEGTAGDQPVYAPGVINKRYLSEWKSLPDGAFFTTNTLDKIRSMNDLVEKGSPWTYDETGNFFPAPRPRGLENNFAGDLKLALPYIGFGPRGQLVGVPSGMLYWAGARWDTAYRNGYFSVEIAMGSRFAPAKDPAGNNTLDDVDEKEEQLLHSRYNRVRINLLTGRSESNLCDVYWNKGESQVGQKVMEPNAVYVLNQMKALHGLQTSHWPDFNQPMPCMLRDVSVEKARLFENLLLAELRKLGSVSAEALMAELRYE